MHRILGSAFHVVLVAKRWVSPPLDDANNQDYQIYQKGWFLFETNKTNEDYEKIFVQQITNKQVSYDP